MERQQQEATSPAVSANQIIKASPTNSVKRAPNHLQDIVHHSSAVKRAAPGARAVSGAVRAVSANEVDDLIGSPPEVEGDRT